MGLAGGCAVMEARLGFLSHALMENRHGLVVDACLTQASGYAERLAALVTIERRADRASAVTLGADKAFDAADFVNELRAMNIRPHVAQAWRLGHRPARKSASHNEGIIHQRSATASFLFQQPANRRRQRCRYKSTV